MRHHERLSGFFWSMGMPASLVSTGQGQISGKVPKSTQMYPKVPKSTLIVFLWSMGMRAPLESTGQGQISGKVLPADLVDDPLTNALLQSPTNALWYKTFAMMQTITQKNTCHDENNHKKVDFPPQQLQTWLLLFQGKSRGWPLRAGKSPGMIKNPHLVKCFILLTHRVFCCVGQIDINNKNLQICISQAFEAIASTSGGTQALIYPIFSVCRYSSFSPPWHEASPHPDAW